MRRDDLARLNSQGEQASLSLSAVPTRKKFGLWHYIWKLLRMRLLLTISSIRRSKPRRKIGLAILTLFILGLAGVFFVGSWLLLGFLRSPVIAQFTDPTLLLNTMPTAIVSIGFVAILLTNFGVLLQSLYLAKDMDFLLSAPLPMRAVFFSKMLQAVLPNFGLVCLFSLPVLFGLGASSHYSFIYYPLVVIAMAMLTLAAGGISGLLVMVVARFIPARRVAEVLGFIGVIVSVFFSQAGRFMNEINLSNQQLETGFNTLLKFNSPFSPLAWVGRGLVAVGNGQYLSGFGLLAVSLGIAGVIFWVALSTAERLYHTGWASLRTGTRAKKKVGIVRHELSGQEIAIKIGSFESDTVARKKSSAGLMPSPLRSVLLKDSLLIRRDLRNLSQLITPLIIGVIIIFSMTRTGMNEASTPDLIASLSGSFTFYTSLGFVLFVGWSFMLSLTMGAFSREGKNYWMIKTAPIRTRDLLLAKFIVAFIPSLVFEWVLIGAIAFLQRTQPGLLLFGAIIAVFYVAGGVGINLMFGVIGARLDWEDPRRMNSTSMGCLGTIMSFVYLPVSIAFFLIPPVGFSLLNLSVPLGQVIGLVLGGILCLGCAFLPPFLVRKRVERIGLK